MRIACFCLLFIVTNFSAYAQSQIGLTAGVSRFKGDVYTSGSKPEIGLFYRFNFVKHFAVRSNLLYTTLVGDDGKAPTNPKEVNIFFRNLSFRSRVVEFNTVFEYYILRHSRKHSPYLFIGGGLFYFNPQTQYRGNWVNLQPLETEGHKYNRTSTLIITGIGYRYSVTEKLTLGFEFGFRFTHTDYIDDVSGNYVNKASLNSQMARDLSDRSGDLIYSPASSQLAQQYQGGFIPDANSTNGNVSGNTPGYRINGYGAEGDKRGNFGKDRYFAFNFTIAYKLSR